MMDRNSRESLTFSLASSPENTIGVFHPERGHSLIQEYVMPDIYNSIDAAEAATIEQIARVLEVRAADTQQRNMLESYLERIDFPENAQVLEIGCGTGAVTRRLAAWLGVVQAVGIDPSSVLIAKARELGSGFSGLSFQEGYADQLPFQDESFDVIVFHTTLCHLSTPRSALLEAFRVLRPEGWLALFDGDYASTTFGTGELDPLQVCADSFRSSFINDSWIARRMPTLARSTGFKVMSYKSHGYTETSRPDYMLTIIDRGADALAETGQIGRELAEAFKTEARRRVDEHQFFGYISYTSLIAQKPRNRAMRRS
jgi:ubiquinone/menaquinone biosynthesis C-methylase UbiE